MQIWPLIINMICRHSIECTTSGDFLLDHMLLGQIDSSVTDHTCPVDVESSDNEKHTSKTLSGKTLVELAMGRDQEIS